MQLYKVWAKFDKISLAIPHIEQFKNVFFIKDLTSNMPLYGALKRL